MSAETEFTGRRAHGPWSDLALHTIGWRAFQDLCSQVCEVVLDRPVEIFREANDGGQDALFLIPSEAMASPIGTVQCKHTSDAGKALKVSNLSQYGSTVHNQTVLSRPKLIGSGCIARHPVHG